MHLRWLLPLQAVITWTVAYDNNHHTTTTNDTCATICTGVSSDVKYDIGHSYVFDVTSRTILKIGQEQDTDVIQNAQAHISVHSSCEFSLKLTRTSIRGMDVGNDWSSILERSSLRFAFDDGEVKAVCPDDNDPTWAVNIKRAILSAFQTKYEGAREEDIHGSCPVNIEKRKSNEMLNLKTSKQLNACYREHDIAGVRTIPYRLESNMQIAPMMETKQICERQIVHYNLQQVTCTEDYRVVSPFHESNLGTLHVEQTLRAVGIAAAPQQESFKERLSIIFDHSNDNFYTKSSPQFAKLIIEELCRSDDRVAPDAASHFSDLVYNLRGLSNGEISSIANLRCDAFIDALAACASHACLLQLGNFINSGAASESLYSSLSLLPNPKKGIMDSVASFIERVPIHGLLAVSSLVQSYCIAHPICGMEPAVQRIVHSISSKLPPGCQVIHQFEEIKEAIIILKSIGNIGYEEHSLSSILKCVANDRIPKEVKIAAIDALRRKPCNDQRNSKITQLFRDQKENVEVRIISFRQLMECVDDEIMQIVVDQLYNETINQVGSYIWSYLNTKQRSTNPGSRNLQHLLKRFHVPQRYNLDSNRFSHYYELGYFDRENNYGGHMDTSILLAPNGYVPREVAFNFTVHLFGKSVNILEIGVRAEGMEEAEEELFGPDGYISNPNGHVFRKKRFQSRYPKLNHLKELYRKKNSGIDNRMRASFYVRMFGDDLHYYGFQRDQYQFLEEVKESIELDKVLSKLMQEKKKKLSRYMLPFELSQTLPTLSGLSLQFLVNISVATKIDSKLQLNLVNLLQRKSSANGHLDLRPSISVARGSVILLRAGHIASGAMIKSSLHAATSVVQSMEMNEGRKLSLKIDVPHKDLLHAKIRNDIIKIESNRHQPSVIGRHIHDATEKHYCSGDTMSKILGIQACINLHADYSKIEGDIKVEKVDRLLNSYQFVVERVSTASEQKLLISMDTPGSEVNRKIETDFEISIPRKKLKLGITAPFKTIILDGNLQQMGQLEDYATNLKLIVDDKVYNLDGMLKATKAGERNSYKLNAKSIVESITTAEVVAELEYSILKPYAMIDFHLDKIFSKPVIFKTLINPEAPKYEGKLEYSGPDFNGKLDTSIIRQGMIDLKGTVNGEYQIDNHPKQVLEIGLEQAFQRRGTNYHFKHAMHAVSTAFNKFDFQIFTDRTGNNMKNSLEITYFGEQLIANLDVIRGPNNIYTAIGKMKFDRLGIDNKVDITYQNRFPLQFMMKIDAETPKIRNIHATAEYVVKIDPKWNFMGNILLRYPDREIAFDKKIDEVTNGQYKMETHLRWDPNSKIDIMSDVIFRPQENEYSIESTANIAGVREPINIKKHIKYQPDNYNIQWHAKQGSRTIYELIANVDGQFGDQQRLKIDINSEKFEPRINYHVTAEVQPSLDSITALATIHKNGRHFGTGNIMMPKKFSLPNQQYRVEFGWIYQDRSRKVAVEYNLLKHTHRSSHAMKVQSDDNLDLNMQFDRHHDKMTLKCDLDKDRIRTISMIFTATPFHWDFFEIDGHLNTDRPLQRRSLKTKAAFLYRTDQANIQGLFEINDERYGIEGHWRKVLHDNGRQYTYAGKIEIPQNRINLEQQLEVIEAITIRKAKTIFEFINVGRIYNLTNEIKSNDAFFSTSTDLIGNGIVLKHTIEYNYKHGQRTLKKHLKYNEKEVNIDTVTVYRHGEVKVNIGASSTFDMVRYGKILFDCRKGYIFWNCDVESNINNQYVVKGHETVSPQNTDIGYLVKLGNVLDTEGKIKFNIDNQASKYNANAMLRRAKVVYNLEMDVNDNKGIVKLQTPTHTIDNPQIRIIRKGSTEFEIHTEDGSGGRIYAHVKTGNYDKLLKIQITEILEPFELHLENNVIGGKQKSIAELTLDPLGQKRTYGVENEIESEGETFRALRSSLKQPKRTIKIELLRPAQNKYVFSVQPHVGGRRQPTVAEMTYQKTTDGYHWEGSISDQALKIPLKAKVVYKKDARDQYNYRLDWLTEFVYSDQPDKLFSNSLHLHRNIIPSKHKKRIAVLHDGRNGNVRFVVELKSIHLASNLNTRLWTKIDRSIIGKVAIPVHATFGLETRNLQRQSTEYSLEIRTDAIKFTEVQLKSPNSLLKTRINKIKDNHYTVGFYQNNERPSVVGELNLQNNGPVFEYRDERSQEVKLHASAQKLNDYEGKIDVWHSEASKKIRDVLLSVEVKEGNVWSSKIYLRPTMESEIMKKAKETVSITGDFHQSSFMKNAFLPIFSSHKQIANDVLTTVDQAIKEWAAEHKNFAAELGTEYTDLVDEIEGNYEIIKEAILVTYDHAYQEMEQFVKIISNSDFVSQLQQLRGGSIDIQREIMIALKPVLDLIDQFYKEIDDLQRNAAIVIDRLEDTLKLNDLRRALEEYKQNFEQTDLIQTVLYEMRKLSHRYQLLNLEQTIVDIEINRKRYEGEAFEIYNKIKNFFLDKIIVSALSKVTSAIFDSLDDIQIRQKWKEIINYLRGKITANEMAKRFWRNYIPTYKRLSPGRYELEVAVPYGVSSLNDVLSNLHPQRFLAFKSRVLESFGLLLKDQEFAQSLSDTIYTYKSAKFNPWKMISLFQSTAYIINGDRFVSFDGKVFAFHARCEYLLASDLRTQRFALLAVFSSQGHLEAIKTELRDEEVILYKTGNVQVSGAQVSIPWQKIDSIDGAILISVCRKDSWTILKTYDGLCVRCNSQYDICEIILPGRMHGRSNGLLGLNDNEPSNDRDLVDGTPNDQLNVLAEHWAVNGECRVNQARDLTHRDDDHCQEYFQSFDSPLRFCFTRIRPKPFEEICSNGGKHQHCTAISAYLEICSNAGIITSLPHECVKCNGDLHLDDERKVEKPIVEHDIVFVVEERKCLDHHKDKIARIAQQISQEQRLARFGWVGFGGEGIHHEPLVHYEEDNALLDVSNFMKQTQQSFEPISGIEVPHVCPKKAVEFTIKHFPFRFASAKSIVLVMCRKCPYREHTEMLDILLEQDITLHLLTLGRFKTSDGSKIIGFDAKQLLNEHGAEIGERTSLLHPHDACTIIAQQTFGTVFSLKHASMVAASRITPKQKSYCFNCQCTAHGLFARNICRPCEAVEPAELASYKIIDSESDNELQLLDVFI
ncbi:putative apolipophorin protein [Dirofilaria immitis]